MTVGKKMKLWDGWFVEMPGSNILYIYDLIQTLLLAITSVSDSNPNSDSSIFKSVHQWEQIRILFSISNLCMLLANLSWLLQRIKTIFVSRLKLNSYKLAYLYINTIKYDAFYSEANWLLQYSVMSNYSVIRQIYMTLAMIKTYQTTSSHSCY